MSAVGFVIDLLVVVPSFLQLYFGVEPSAFFGWFIANAGWLLPVSSLALGAGAGALIGWSIRNGQAKRERETLETTHAEGLSGIEKRLGMSVDEAAAKLQERADHDTTVWELEERLDALGGQCSYLAQQNEDLEEALAELGCAAQLKNPNPHGFSKRALNAWDLMEDRDKRSLGRLLGASVLRGVTPLFPLVMDMDGSLADIGLDASMVKSLEALGILERYPQRALQPIPDTEDKKPLLDGVDVCRGEAFFSTPEGIYATEGCAALFCGGGADFASSKTQCVDLGLYGFSDIGQEILPHIETLRSPKLFSYLDRAYGRRRDAERPFGRWALET